MTASLGAAISPVQAATYLSNKWRGSPPISLVFVNVSVTDQYLVQGINQAAASWGASTTFDISVGGKGSKKVYFYQGEYGTTGYQMAWMSADSKSGNGYINQASISFNMSHMGDLDSVGEPGSLKRAIVCHEVGHALSLDHVEDPEAEPTCMTPGTNGEYPSAQDFANLEALYGG